MTYTAPTVTKLQRQCEASELLMNAGTPDPQQIWKPAVGLWSCISGMTRTMNPSSQLKCETLELPTLAGTPDLRRNSQRTNPRTTILQLLDKYRTRPVWIPRHVRYCQTSKKSVSSFIAQILKTHMGWLEHLWNIIYQHDASLLIVRHTY